MWGTYWVWDARLTSFLLLLFLYLGYMALWNAIEDETRAARAAAILALVGAVNIPIIKFSVDWWNTLHQGESIVSGKLAPVFLAPLLLMMAGYMLLFADAVDGAHPHRHPGAARPQPDAGGACMNFDMGAYGAFIWPAYGVSALAAGRLTVWTLCAWRARQGEAGGAGDAKK